MKGSIFSVSAVVTNVIVAVTAVLVLVVDVLFAGDRWVGEWTDGSR